MGHAKIVQHASLDINKVRSGMVTAWKHDSPPSSLARHVLAGSATV